MVDPGLKAVLDTLAMGHLAEVFAAEDIDITLLWSLQDSDLRELGLTLGQRRRLLQHIADHQPKARPAPKVDKAEPDLRRLSVLFCDLVGYTALTTQADPDEIRTMLGAYYAATSEVAQDFGGFVAAQQGDGMVILFGYPATLEGTASRAIGAAHALLGRVGGLPLRLSDGRRPGLSARIGIASGPAIVGLAANTPGTDLMMVGPVINRAARLQAIARSGTVVVDAATRSMAAAAFAFADLPDEALKGFDGKVSVSQALNRPAASAAPAGAAGYTARSLHQAEAAALRALWEQAAAGPPRIALICGEAGIGKSTLLDETASDVAAMGASVLRLACTALRARDALNPVKEALARTLGMAEGAAASALFPSLRHLLGAATPEEVDAVAEFIGLLAPVPFADTSPDVRRQRLLGGLMHFLAGTAPRLVVVEDVHWADPTTRELLDLCARRPCGHGVLMVAASRAVSDALWSGQQDRSHLVLKRLNPETAAQLLDGMLGNMVLPDRILDEILTRSGGIPLMLASLARLVEGRAEAVLSNGYEVPASIYESIARQLESVPEGRSLAAALSVLDQPSDPALLGRLLNVSPCDLGPAITALVAAGVCQVGEDGAPLVGFRHNLYRAVSYERLVKSTREQLHRAAFAALGAENGNDPGLLAHHAFEGGDHVTAVPLALTAADEAMRRSALVEAEQFVQQALTALDRVDPGTRRDRLLLRALVAQAALARARKGIAAPELRVLGQRIQQLAKAQGETRSEMIALSGLYANALVGADYAQARSWAMALREVAEATQDQTFGMIATRGLGVVAFHDGAFDTAADLLTQAMGAYDEARHLPLAYAHGYDHAEVSAAFLSLAHWVRGDLRAAADVGAFSVAHSRRIGHMPSLAQALAHQALLAGLAGHPETCIALAREGAEISARHGLAAMHAINEFLVFLAGLLAGPDAPSAPMLDSLWTRNDAFRAVVANVYQPAIGVLMAGACLAGKDCDRAEQALHSAAAWQDRTGDQFVRPEILRLRAQVAVLRGDAAAGLTGLQDAMAVAQSMGAASFALRIACDLAEAERSAQSLHRLQTARDRLVSTVADSEDLMRCDRLLALPVCG